MLNELKRLPFAERNEQDFEDLTKKISDALAIIRKSRSIPATQEKLAELADCTRKTLHNRDWPISELKKIKEERKANKDSKQKNATVEHRLSAEKHIAREKLLIGQMRNMHEQNGQLFDRVQELEEQAATSTDTIKVLGDEIVVLKDKNRQFEKELRQLKQSRNGKSNVVNIRAMKETK
jgi:FtsZ-binding cell division protein ZapB